ncbi:MAG: hypothetical protein WCQ41_01365 [Bacillota bacterium]
MRGINNVFINDLNGGVLKDFLSYVKANDDLSLEIRKDYINIYYRGGNALKISQTNRGYSFFFDAKYCKNKGDDSKFDYLSSLKKTDYAEFLKAFPVILKEMDSWFVAHPKPEREYQHQLVKSNPFIVDIEYAGRTEANKLFRLDMVGVVDDKIYIFENKLGSSAVSGSAGLCKHYNDIVSIINSKAARSELIESIINISKNKNELKLIKSTMNTSQLEIEILFIIADFNEKSETINNEIKKFNGNYSAYLWLTKGDEFKIDFKKVTKIY